MTTNEDDSAVVLLQSPEDSQDNLPAIIEKLLSEDYSDNKQPDYSSLEKFLKHKKEYVNIKDSKGNYPLHKATHTNGPYIVVQHIVKELLKNGASLVTRNNGVQTIDKIDYHTLKDHFDSCIQEEDHAENPPKLVFDYTNIMPPMKEKSKKSDNLEKIEDTSVNENCFPNFLGKFKEVRVGVESEIMFRMSKLEELKPLLTHPLITSFLYLKWEKIKWLYYLNILIYSSFVISIYLYSMNRYLAKNYNVKFPYFLLIMSLIIFVRELIQVITDTRKYFKNLENYVELGLLFIVFYIVIEPNPSDETVRRLAAFGIIFSAFGFEFLLGKHPYFSNHIVMLRTVSKNFFKCLLFYIIPIVAFSCSFYILFRFTNTTDEKEKEPYPTALFKTFLMITGDIDSSTPNFDKHPVVSRLIFLSFVMTIGVILLNLLNGLAVSEIQIIKSEAELVDQVCRAEFIAHAESLIQNCLDAINYIFCLGYSTYQDNPILNFIANKIIWLYPHNHFSDKYEIKVYKNSKDSKINNNGFFTCFNKNSKVNKTEIEDVVVNLNKNCIKKALGIIYKQKKAMHAHAQK